MTAHRVRAWGRAWVVVLPVVALALGSYRGGLFAQYSLFAGATALLAFVWGVCGILSFAQAVPFGIGAYATGWFSLREGGWGCLAGLGVGLLVAAAVCLIVGLIGLRRKFEVITFALVTFLVVLAAQQLVNQWTGITGGFDGLNSIPTLHVGRVFLSGTAQQVVVCAVVALVLLVLALLTRSPLGAAMMMVRDHPRRAAALGYNVPAIRIGVFTFAGLATGLLGGLYATQA
ncbi:MAG: branched-chain amino acid ABC transporter permease, partial [Solirubrobacteraceae bacterium]